MENHICLKANQLLYKLPCSIAMLNYQRVLVVYIYIYIPNISKFSHIYPQKMLHYLSVIYSKTILGGS